MNDKIFLGLSGLATDIQTVYEKLKFRVNLYQLREERDIEPKPFARMVSKMLYERRYAPVFAQTQMPLRQAS